MSSESSVLEICDPEVHEKGSIVATVDALYSNIIPWLESIKEQTGATLDFHWRDGCAQILHLGDEESRMRVGAAIRESRDAFKGKIVNHVNA
jgi:hypothetical protein